MFKKIKKFSLLFLFCNSTALANQCYILNDIDHERVIGLLNAMTLEQKVGQIVQGDLDFVTPADMERFYLGTVLNGGNTSPNGNQFASAEEWKALSEEFYEASPVINGQRIPFLWGTDAVHGHNNLVGATVFPHNIGLGATRNIDLLETIGSAIALEVLSTGVTWTFAPAISVPQNDRWGRTYEGYSENPELVGELGRAFIYGLQGRGDTFLDDNHVMATAKHFAGDGGTFEGIDQGDVRVPMEVFEELHIAPYYDAIEACPLSIMASFNSYYGVKMHGSQELLTNKLKDEMAFGGLIVGDWNGHGQVEGCSNQSCPEALEAGVDIYMAPDSWRDLHRNLVRDVRNGTISETRLDDAVYRVLTAKLKMGLLDGRLPHAFEENYLGHPEHRELARQAVRESLVLLKNNDQVLPINPTLRIGVIGEASQEIRYQMGGWTLDWQGRNNRNEDFPGVVSIYQAIEETVLASGGSVEFSADGNFQIEPDLVISVFGEEPYAEGFGDQGDVKFIPTESEHLSAHQTVNANNIPTVSIFLSGRALEVNEYINLSDAFIAAWLPGSEVRGITDVIFMQDNEINYDFSGRLSYSWPKNRFQETLNINDSNYDPLFAYGYGLDYQDTSYIDTIEILDENLLADVYEFFRGVALGGNIEFTSSSGNVELVDTNPFVSSDGSVETVLFQYERQDDAKRINFSGDDLSSYGITGESLSINHLESPYFEVMLRVNENTAPIYFYVACGDQCQATVDLGEFSGNWENKVIPLSCLENQGFDSSLLSIRGMFLTSGDAEIEVHEISLNSGFNGRNTIEYCR